MVPLLRSNLELFTIEKVRWVCRVSWEKLEPEFTISRHKAEELCQRSLGAVRVPEFWIAHFGHNVKTAGPRIKHQCVSLTPGRQAVSSKQITRELHEIQNSRSNRSNASDKVWKAEPDSVVIAVVKNERIRVAFARANGRARSEEHTSELQ